MAQSKRPLFAPILYALIVRDADGEKVGNAGSPRDEEGTRRMCHELMRLFPDTAFVDIYDWSPGLNWGEAQPRETVYHEP